jgi:hypothetical protein
VIVLLVLDVVLGWALSKLYFKQKRGQLAQTTYAIDSADQDILIFGSSKTLRQYSPKIISKGTGLSCYNLGRDAQKIPYCAALEEVVLKRKKPKLIILDILSRELYEDDLKYSKLWILLPYCKEHPEFVKYIADLSPYEKNKLLLQSLPYNSFLFLMLNNLIFEKYITKDELGFKPLNHSLTKEEMATLVIRKNQYDEKIRREGNIKPDQKSIQYFKEFLNRSRENNIKTFVIISPCLMQEPSFYRNSISEICKNYSNVVFLDGSENANYNLQNEKYADFDHLNKLGAEFYSKELNLVIQNYLKK